MALLDDANTSAYGHPVISEVNLGVGKNPGILISGHDLRDIQQLLEQTEGTGVDAPPRLQQNRQRPGPVSVHPACAAQDAVHPRPGANGLMQNMLLI